jgi:hypothetical protein
MYTSKTKSKFVSECSGFDVAESSVNDCVIYLGNQKDRYYFNGKSRTPKIFAYLLVFPEMEEKFDHILKRTCDNDDCVNPHHMFANERTKEKKIPQQSGAIKKKVKPRLTKSEIKEIREIIRVNDGTLDPAKVKEIVEKRKIPLKKVVNIGLGKLYGEKKNG